MTDNQDFFDGVAILSIRASTVETLVRSTFGTDPPPRRSRMARHAYNHSQLRLLSAADHLTAWAADIKARQTLRVFASTTLVRAALEAAIVAHWILEAPSATERHARGAQAHYKSLTEEATATASVVNYEGDEPRTVLEAFAAEYFDVFGNPKNKATPPSLNVASIFDQNSHLVDNDHLTRLGYKSRFLWNYLSGTTHHHSWTFRSTPIPNSVLSNLQPDSDLLSVGAEAALQIAECAGHSFVRLYG